MIFLFSKIFFLCTLTQSDPFGFLRECSLFMGGGGGGGGGGAGKWEGGASKVYSPI